MGKHVVRMTDEPVTFTNSDVQRGTMIKCFEGWTIM